MDNKPETAGPFVVENVEAFVAITSRLATVFAAHAWFRGQSDASWTLRPSIARREWKAGHEPNRCIHFMNRARTWHNACPPSDDLPGWLFLMQHYGLHTRLLDWTEAPLVALYFAVEAHDATEAAVHVLDPHRLNAVHGHKPGVLLPHHPDARKLIAPAFKSSDPISAVVAVLPPEMDYRMLLQRSVFTVHGDTAPLDSHPRESEFLAKMVVPANRRTDIKRQLHALWIDRAHLFPDLSNLATYLNAGTGGAT